MHIPIETYSTCDFPERGWWWIRTPCAPPPLAQPMMHVDRSAYHRSVSFPFDMSTSGTLFKNTRDTFLVGHRHF